MKILKGNFNKVRLKLEFCKEIKFKEFAQECTEAFKSRFGFDVYNVLDKKGNLFMVGLRCLSEGIRYEIIITNQEFNIYAENSVLVQDDRMLYKFEQYLHLLLEIIRDCQIKGLSSLLKNVCIVRYYEDGKELLKLNKIKTDVELKVEGDVSIVAKFNENTSGDLIIYSSFLDNLDVRTFFSNISEGTSRLYNVFI